MERGNIPIVLMKSPTEKPNAGVIAAISKAITSLRLDPHLLLRKMIAGFQCTQLTWQDGEVIEMSDEARSSFLIY
jgi:hypothetical protein